jgi:rhodanese-related sulfurtransferase
LLRLSKDAFNEHVKDRLVTWVTPTEAQRKIADGALWVDVREESGEMISRLSGAMAVPLSTLRESMGDFSKEADYVCYCQNGRLSSTAAFLLAQREYSVAVMRGGLKGMERAKLL